METVAKRRAIAGNGVRTPIVVFADFVCPWSYILQDQVDPLATGYNIDLRWRPYWLHPEVPPKGLPKHARRSEDDQRQFLAWMKEFAPARAAKMRVTAGLQYSLLAFEAMTFAEDAGLAIPFRQAVFEALWEQGADIGRVGTLETLGTNVGLDGSKLGQTLSEGTYRTRTLGLIAAARRVGVTSTPTTFVGKTRVDGYHYYEVFQTLLERLGTKRLAARTQ